MLDHEHRNLERRWRETGEPDDEAALIQARLRTGALSQQQVLLASVVGHEPARACFPDVRREPLFCDLCYRLAEWGREAALRAGVAATTYMYGRWTWPHAEGDPREVLWRIEDWLTNPSEALAQRVTEQAEQLLAAIHRAEGDEDFGFVIHGNRNTDLAGAASLLGFVVGASAFEEEERRDLVRALTGAERVLDDDEELRIAIREEITPWALSYGDPIRDRVMARLREAGVE